MSNRSTIATLLFGGLTAVSLLGWIMYLISKQFNKPKAAITYKAKGQSPTKPVQKPVENAANPDEDDDDDYEDIDEEEEDEKGQLSEEEQNQKAAEEEAQQLKSDYDTAVRLARKLLDGHSYEKAAAKYTEALDLAGKISSASKDVLTLYNNRSAMYEKCNQYEKSLNDITVVLAMDPRHIKARTRRARILEAQGKLKESMQDYVYAMILEQSNGEHPSNISKIDELAKVVARSKAGKIVEEMRKSVGRALPPKAYCRNFFESLPAIHRWKEIYTKADKDELVSALEKSITEKASNAEILSSGLNLVKFYIVSGLFGRALDEELSRLAPYVEAESANAGESNLSLFWELKGTNCHLRCNLSDAINFYKKALEYDANNIEAAMKLASVHLELGETEQASEIYSASVARVQDDDSNKPWVFIHRSTLWTTRDEKGAFVSGALAKALEDIAVALSLTENCGEDGAMKAARIAALLKYIQASTHTKSQTGDAVTPEDVERNKAYILEAKTLGPTNDTVSLMQADMASGEGDIETALKLVDESQKTSDPDDGMLYVVRANIVTQRAFHEMAMAQQGNPYLLQVAQTSFAEAGSIYETALKVEPMCIEALTQFAQLKQMLGDPVGAVELTEQALKYGRSRDEVQELCQLNVMAQAQLAAFQELQGGQ